MQMMHCGQLIPNINVLVADGSLTVYILHTPLTVLDVLTIDHVPGKNNTVRQISVVCVGMKRVFSGHFRSIKHFFSLLLLVF